MYLEYGSIKMRSTRGAVQFDRDLFSVVCFFCGGFLENDGRCICFGLLVSLSLLFKLCFATTATTRLYWNPWEKSDEDQRRPKRAFPSF